jgi:hypothetical protein
MGWRKLSAKPVRSLFRRSESVAIVLRHKSYLDRCDQTPWGGRPGIRLTDDTEGPPEKHQRFIQPDGKGINGERVLSGELVGYIDLPQF